MHDFQTLMTEHDEMDALAVNLMEIVCATPDPAHALAIRANLSVALDEHLAKEDAFLYDRLIEKEQDDYPAAIRRFRSCFADLAADWSDYLRSWDGQCVAADWHAFADETLSIMERLRARIAAENDLLYPVALQRNHIRLRA